MTTEKEAYEVTVNGAYHAYVYADSKPKARTIALKHVEIRKLRGSEVARLIADGIAIDDGGDAQE